jgi:hypothetical protein
MPFPFGPTLVSGNVVGSAGPYAGVVISGNSGAALSPFSIDHFKDADNTLLTAHTQDVGPGWVACLGYQMVISANTAIDKAGSTDAGPPGGIVANATTGDTLIVLETLAASLASFTPAIALRLTTNNGFGIYVFMGYGTANTFKIQSYDGTWHDFAGNSATYAPLDGSYLRITVQCSGQMITVWGESYNSAKTQIMQITGVALNQTATYFGLSTWDPNSHAGRSYRYYAAFPAAYNSFPYNVLPTHGGYYIFPYFIGNGGATVETLVIAAGTDGDYFQLVPAVYTPTGGHYVRDPAIYYNANLPVGAGSWLVAHTNQSSSNNYVSATFDVAYSSDGLNWTYLASVAGLGNQWNWAPFWLLDPNGPTDPVPANRACTTAPPITTVNQAALCTSSSLVAIPLPTCCISIYVRCTRLTWHLRVGPVPLPSRAAADKRCERNMASARLTRVG